MVCSVSRAGVAPGAVVPILAHFELDNIPGPQLAVALHLNARVVNDGGLGPGRRPYATVPGAPGAVDTFGTLPA